MATHKFDWNEDRCACGGQVVWFEDIPKPTHGCEVGGPWYTSGGRPVDGFGRPYKVNRINP